MELIGSPCTVDCHRPTGKAVHCTVCHETFAGVTEFDRHRAGGRCLKPETVGTRTQLWGATWRKPHDDSSLARPAVRPVDAPESFPGTSGTAEPSGGV